MTERMRSCVVDRRDYLRRLEMNELEDGVEFVISVNIGRRVISVEVAPQQVKFVRDELNKYLARFMAGV